MKYDPIALAYVDILVESNQLSLDLRPKKDILDLSDKIVDKYSAILQSTRGGREYIHRLDKNKFSMKDVLDDISDSGFSVIDSRSLISKVKGPSGTPLWIHHVSSHPLHDHVFVTPTNPKTSPGISTGEAI